MADTELQTEVVLSATDRMTPVANQVAAAFNKAHGAANGLMGTVTSIGKSALFSAAGAVGIGFGFSSIAHKIIDANMELDDMQDKVAGSLFAFRNWKKGVDTSLEIESSIEGAKAHTEELKKISYDLATSGQEVAGIFGQIAGPVLQRYTTDEKKLIDITKGATAANALFGQSASMVLRNLLERKTIVGKDQMSVYLRTQIGTQKELQKMKPEALFEKTRIALDKLVPAARRLSDDMGGNLKRLKMTINEVFLNVGGPAFEYLTSKIKEWGAYLQSTTADGKTIASVWGDKVLNAVKAVGDALVFVRDHWKEIALLVGGIKLGGLVGSAAAGGGGMLASLAGALGGITGEANKVAGVGLGALIDPLESAGKNLTAFGSKLPEILGALGAFAAALEMGAKWLDEWQGEQRDAKGAAEGLATILEPSFKGTAETAAKIAQSLGYINQQGQVNAQLIQQGLQQFDSDKLAQYAVRVGLKEGASAGMISDMLAEQLRKAYVPPPVAAAAPPETGKGILDKKVPKGNTYFTGDISIKQDFKDADPDRVFVRFKNDLESLADRRKQSSESEVYGA